MLYPQTQGYTWSDWERISSGDSKPYYWLKVDYPFKSKCLITHLWTLPIMITMQRGGKRHSLNKWTHVCKCRKRASVSPLKASADGGILGSLNHGMQLLRKFQRCSSHKACWLLSNPVQYDRTLDLKTSHAAIVWVQRYDILFEKH